MVLCKSFSGLSAEQDFNLWSLNNADCEITDIFVYPNSVGIGVSIVVFYETEEGN